MELFPINGTAFRYLKITKNKFSHNRHSTCIQTVHFRESKHVVCVPTHLTHISLKTNADIREHAAKGSVNFAGSWVVSGWTVRLSSCNHQRTVFMSPATVSAPRRV